MELKIKKKLVTLFVEINPFDLFSDKAAILFLPLWASHNTGLIPLL